MDAVSWVDIGFKDFELVVADFIEDEGAQAVVLRGSGPLPEGSEPHLRSAGFAPVPGPRCVWARAGGSFRPRELLAAFPKLRRADRPLGATRVRVRGPYPFRPPSAPVSGEAPGGLPAVQPPPGEEAPSVARRGNDLQSVYKPASRIGSPVAMIPVNMEAATTAALDAIEDRYGQIDGFLAERLGLTEEGLAEVLSPEQVDAAAMALAAAERGREMILADATGLGKGRVLAATMLAATRAGRTVVFITEKANLFSDIYRDLADVGAVDALGTPFLFNSGSRVIDVTSLNGDVLHEALPDPELRKVIKSKTLPTGCRFVLCTYSQFNRVGSAKEAFLTEIAKDAYVVVDEAHNAAGADSNTSQSLERALAGAWGVLRSSATFARNAEALLKYPRVLPPSLADEDVRAALQAGGNGIAEAIAQYLAEDGVLIRREHDLSGIAIEVVVDEARRDANMEYSDALAPILSKLARLQRMVDDEIETRNEDAQNSGGKAARERWYTANFGSRKAPLMRQFLTALSVEQCIDRCVDSLLAGKKPVVVIEQTMESLMRELSGSADPGGDDGEAAEGEALAGTKPPDFRDALNLVLDRVLQMSVRKGKEDPEKVPVEDPYILAEAEAIRRDIEAFPPLSLSPIDDIRDRIESTSRLLAEDGRIDRAWRADEISARNLRVENGVYAPVRQVDRNETIVAFNSGEVDALVITGAASTGLSLHAAERARDKRRRRMIELEIPSNVVARIQFWGRVNRRGQVSVPEFEALSTGLPAQMRTMAMNNRKVESLSATVSANSSTATLMDVPDMLDAVGNEVAKRILTDQPSIAERMFIAMRGIDEETAEQELYYINKFLQGFPYLSSAEGEELFEKLLDGYRDATLALKARGRSPRGGRELDGVWREVSRERYEEGSPSDGPVFGRPVDLVVMEGTFERNPVSGERIGKLIAEARRRLSERSGRPAGPFFEEEVKAIRRSRRAVLGTALSGRYISVDAALKDKEANAVKAADERLKSLCEHLAELEPMRGLSMRDEEGNERAGVIVDIRLREGGRPHLPSEWTVRYACPGDTSISEISIATLIRDRGYRLHPRGGQDGLESVKRRFDAAPAGMVTETRQFLDGNLVRAMLVATEVSAGSMVTFTDEGGEVRRSVLVHKRGRQALMDRISSIRDAGDAFRHLTSGRAVFTNHRERAKGLIVRADERGGFIVQRPRGRAFDKMMEGGPGSHCGTFKADRGGVLVARMADHALKPFLDAIFGSGLPLYYDSRTISLKQNRFAGGQQSKASPKAAFSSPRPGF